MDNFKNWEEIDFTIYFSFLKWPVIITLIIELSLRLWSFFKPGFISDNNQAIIWLVRLLILAYIGWKVIKNFGGSTPAAAMAGAIAGAEIGLVSALARFLSGIQLWKFFNLVTETAGLAVAGSLMAIAVVFIFTDRSNQ